MTPADERVLQLLQKWQKSLDLHSRYADLPEDQYWLVQPWPNHQRPTKWVVDLARQRLADLQSIVKTRLAAADPSLVRGARADVVPDQPRRLAARRAVRADRRTRARAPARVPRRPKSKPTGATSTSTVVKPGRPAAPRQKTAAKAAKPPVNDTTVTAVVKDAARLLTWGRDWHELPEAIARIAGRPSVQQVRQILRSSKSAIEQRIAAQDKH